jgi:Fic family protein
MSDLFDSLTALQAEWQALQPLQAEHQDRLWRKFRLEWNYHSNHIEGNTLTYGETELLLLHDRTTGNHSHREYLEMKAHDVGIEHVRSLAADSERIITEADIRDLNKIILKEPFWKAAETADGQATRKQIIPGEYKTSPNNVRTASGEMFYFASVEDTQPKMQALAAWLRQELETPTLHPVALATKLHHEFVLIHPFDDGNGRVARLLVNYVLLRNGYLPVIVRSEDKANYLTALRLADAGDMSPLLIYLARLAEWSLGTGIKAGRGEPIDEPGDVEKAVTLFVREQQARKVSEPQPDPIAIRDVIELSIKPFLSRLDSKLQRLVPLFVRSTWKVVDGRGKAVNPPMHLGIDEDARVASGERISILVMLNKYQGANTAPFDCSVAILIHFRPTRFQITEEGVELISRDYGSSLLAEEVEILSEKILASAFQRIKAEAEKRQDA